MFNQNQNKVKMATVNELLALPKQTSHVRYKSENDRMWPLLVPEDIRSDAGSAKASKNRMFCKINTFTKHYEEYSLCL